MIFGQYAFDKIVEYSKEYLNNNCKIVNEVETIGRSCFRNSELIIIIEYAAL